jgi:transcriptional regulator with XRE-family HTH domain
MERKGLTQAELARQMGVKDSQITRWLAGQMPRGDMAVKLCKLLGLSLESLFLRK